MKKFRFMKQGLLAGMQVLGCMLATTAFAQSVVLPLQTHAAFYSDEMRLNQVIDPQVFVADAAAPGGVGPQGIHHVAGLRNARASDPGSTPLLNANAQPLHLSVGEWLGARGDVLITQRADGKETVTVILSNLVADGHYSLFENHFDQRPIGFTPLDGNGSANSFIAGPDGNAVVTTVVPSALNHDNAVLVVYHSDAQTHGLSRGDIGTSAQHQLIARP
jgi:hypothetical protein